MQTCLKANIFSLSLHLGRLLSITHKKSAFPNAQSRTGKAWFLWNFGHKKHSFEVEFGMTVRSYGYDCTVTHGMLVQS